VTFAALQNMGKILSTNALYLCPNHLTVIRNAENRQQQQFDTREVVLRMLCFQSPKIPVIQT